MKKEYCFVAMRLNKTGKFGLEQVMKQADKNFSNLILNSHIRCVCCDMGFQFNVELMPQKYKAGVTHWDIWQISQYL